jgi:hypothetical protein
VNSQRRRRLITVYHIFQFLRGEAPQQKPRLYFMEARKSSIGPQQHNKWVLPMDRLFHCADMETGSTKQMEDICGQQSCHHSRRNIYNMESHAVSIQSCWFNIKHHHRHYGGRGRNGNHRNHQAGLPQRSTLLQTTWKTEMYMLQLYILNKASHPGPGGVVRVVTLRTI